MAEKNFWQEKNGKNRWEGTGGSDHPPLASHAGVVAAGNYLGMKLAYDENSSTPPPSQKLGMKLA